ncbi:hypothetical protein PsYK624_073930 [Phanerochaete sordida]|uniref:Uncharacterized protein n=1 Tax=Phanerochaete sordida TaxID=48140 RepID=A0A9P3GBC6_9APHY|nr:hypothetical protein PsYK624_073930 [Phanerochaete sordida]
MSMPETILTGEPAPAPGLRHLANVEYSDLFTILATRDRTRFREARAAYALKGGVAAPRLPAPRPPPRLRTRLSKGSTQSMSDDDLTLVNDEIELLIQQEKEAALEKGIESIEPQLLEEPVLEAVVDVAPRVFAPPAREPAPTPKRALPTAAAGEVPAAERDAVFSHYVAQIRAHYTFDAFQDTIRDILEESQKKYRPLAEGVPAPMPEPPLSAIDVEEAISERSSEVLAELSSAPEERPGVEAFVAAKKPRVERTAEPAEGTAKARFLRKQLLLDLVACALPHKLNPQWKRVKLSLGKPKAWLRASRKRDLSDVD